MIRTKDVTVNGCTYIIRHALLDDAKFLSELRLQIDGETENLDREKGEDFLSEADFTKMIKNDTESPHSLFLVAEVDAKLVGFIRAVGNDLKRTKHLVEFGIGVLKDYWGYRIGRNLLTELIKWADSHGIRKISLHVLETNVIAKSLYEKLGFEVEGTLKEDKLLSDGHYYNTIVMGRINKYN
ncbi:GNAT family N-acetyltransferase [Radiobacillus deserti]|uniref:GNAT family N-acetyltransferase n=1 Tax=Radiobacillus deserti TaxID=2594883 RepID=A0A516KDF9_9BACI|nr:GNAT family N-acetyltransferase [Radiobacillus deserti]QDP39346.1 GNAT family N-acetyltransferase [Radiobacillus deserti]